MKRHKLKRILLLIYYLIPVLFVMFRSPVAAGTIDVSLVPSLFSADCPVTAVGDGVSFDIDRRATILIKLAGVAQAHIGYRAEGYFRLDYATARRSRYEIDPDFLVGGTLQKGRARVKLDLRRTYDWSPETFALLLIEGTGRFTIESLRVVTLPDPSRYEPVKNSTFFWRPENMRPNLMNFITPVYWDFSKKILWTKLLGTIFLVTVLALAIFCFYRKQNVMRYLPAIALLFMLASGLHFAVRFMPMINGRFYLTEKEKIKKYYPLPELGQLVVAARENTQPGDKVAVMTQTRDWFAKKTLCFNLFPVKCAYYKPGDKYYYGLSEFPKYFEASNTDVIVSYNSHNAIPSRFEKVYQLNDNVFIARRK